MDKMYFFRKILGSPFKLIAIIIFIVTGLWAFVLSISVINDALGFLGVVLGILFTPILLAAAPWYVLVEYGSFKLLIITYGGLIVGWIFYFIGLFISGNE